MMNFAAQKWIWVGIGLTWIGLGCHVKPAPHMAAWDQLPVNGQRQRLVKDSQHYLHARRIAVGERSFPFDCSGLVGAVLLKNGIDVFAGARELDIRGNGVRILRQFVLRYGELYEAAVPAPGDFLFFSNTYDRNRDRKRNDIYTHIGVVEQIDRDGTITFIHHLGNGVRRSVINLQHPRTHRNANGKVINDFLRRRRRNDSRRAPYLAGALFTEFGTIVRNQALAEN